MTVKPLALLQEEVGDAAVRLDAAKEKAARAADAYDTAPSRETRAALMRARLAWDAFERQHEFARRVYRARVAELERTLAPA